MSIAPGSGADKTADPTVNILYDQPIAVGAPRIVVSERHHEEPDSDLFGTEVNGRQCELDEIRLDIRRQGSDPVRVSSYISLTQGSPYHLKEQAAVLCALVSHGKIAVAMAGENSIAIWEVNLLRGTPVKWRILREPWTPMSGVYWIDTTRAEVNLKLDPGGHLMVGVRDKSQPEQPQPFSWYEEEPEPFASGFKAVRAQ